MTPFERLQRCIERRDTDRSPVALWRHFPRRDQTIDGLVNATCAWQQHGFDFVKVMPSASFCLRDWGCVDHYSPHPHGVRHIIHRPIEQPGDWRRLEVLVPTRGYLGQHLQALREISRRFSGRVPVFATVFSPLSQALNLIGEERMTAHLAQDSAAVRHGLDTIARTTAAFIDAIVRLNLDGVFWVERWAQSPFDLTGPGPAIDAVPFAAMARLRWNILHLHHGRYDPARYTAAPFHILSHHDLDSISQRHELLTQFPGALCGGLRRDHELRPDALATITAAWDRLGDDRDRGLIWGADCGLRMDTPAASIKRVLELAHTRRMAAAASAPAGSATLRIHPPPSAGYRT